MRRPERRYLRGLPIDQVDMDEAVAVCLGSMAENAALPLRVITVNPEMVMRAAWDTELAGVFKGETLVVPDGTGIALAGWRRRWPRSRRVPGIDLMLRLAEAAAEKGWPVFLFGGLPGVAEQAARTLCAMFPGLTVSGTACGYLDPEELSGLPARIKHAGAGMVFAGLGLGRQETWLKENLAAAGARLGMGVGGSLDVLAGRVRRAPPFMRRIGCEWLYRLWREPRRWRRMLVLPGFLRYALWPNEMDKGERK